ncbi:MAG: hypothetical protein U0414_18640 [Polyangiaceae bacterium]
MKVLSWRKFAVNVGLCTVVAGAAALSGAGCEVAETGDEQDATAALDDAFSKSALAGGCSVKNVKTGKTVKTKGTKGACPKTVTGILDILQNDTKNKLHTYVVSEQGDQPAKTTPYRFVIAVEVNGAPAEKLFLSVLGTGEAVSEDFMEVIAFNEKKGAYVFYDLDANGWSMEGDGTMVKTDAVNNDAPFRCINCHKTGAPLMKELHDSWGNWFSTWFTPGDPMSADALFKRLFDNKERADDLEGFIINGTKAHAKTRVDKAVKEKNLKPIMTQLMCDVGEPSIIQAHSKNSKRLGTVETFSSMVPSAIVLNNFFKVPATGTGTEDGLTGLGLSIPSLSSLKVDSAAYVKAIGTIGQKINGQAGDTIFPMSSPEKSFSDFMVIEDLMGRGLLDKDVVADALMVDFTVSTFSKARCDLAETLPANWTSADDLKTQWSAALATSSVRGAKGLKARLDNKTDTDAHAATLDKFVSACNARGTADKNAWALDLLKVVSQRRVEFAEVYGDVIESPWLIPTDSLKSVAHKSRLNGTTCVLEDQTKPFVGE